MSIFFSIGSPKNPSDSKQLSLSHRKAQYRVFLPSLAVASIFQPGYLAGKTNKTEEQVHGDRTFTRGLFHPDQGPEEDRISQDGFLGLQDKSTFVQDVFTSGLGGSSDPERTGFQR